MVNVSTGALIAVRDALSDFLTDVEEVSSSAARRESETDEACRRQLSAAKNDVEQSEALVASLTKEVDAAEEKLREISNMLYSLKKNVEHLQVRIENLEKQIYHLDSQISDLRAQLSRCENEDLRSQIQGQIQELEKRQNQFRAEKQSAVETLDATEKRMKGLYREQSDTKARKAELETRLEKEKVRCYHLKDKLDRLKNAYTRVVSELRAYVAAAKNFEAASSSTTQRNKNAVERCLSHIETYLNTGL